MSHLDLSELILDSAICLTGILEIQLAGEGYKIHRKTRVFEKICCDLHKNEC
jgi:hypothetical protein